MKRNALYIIMCVLAAMWLSCSRHQPVPAVDAVGPGARCVAEINLAAIAKNAGSGASKIKIPEIEAISRARGIDFERCVAVSYSPSMSAMVFSIENARLLKNTIGTTEASDSVATAHRVADGTYFVADTAWLWLVDSRKGPEGALEKAEAMRRLGLDSIEGWKKKVLENDTDIRGVAAYGEKFVSFTAGLDNASLYFHAACLGRDGEFARWLTSADDWRPLSVEMAKIDPRNRFSLAIGRIRLEEALQSLPSRLRFSLADAGLEDFAVVGPVNIAANSMSSFRATIETETPDEAARLAAAAERQWGRVPGVEVERVDSVVTVYSEADAPALYGTSYAGCVLVGVLNLPADEVRKFTGLEGVGMSAIVSMHGSTLDGHIGLVGSSDTFLSTLIRIIDRD